MIRCKRIRTLASDLPTGSHPLPRPSSCPIAYTCKSFVTYCPTCFDDDQQCDVPCTSTSECGTTNGPEVGWQHIAPSSSAFPHNARTNISPNIVEQIVQPVHSNHAGFHAKVVTSLWQQVGRPRFQQFSEYHINIVEVIFENRPVPCSKTSHWSDNRIKISKSSCQRHMSVSQDPSVCTKCP